MNNINYLHRVEFPELTSLTNFEAAQEPVYFNKEKNYDGWDSYIPISSNIGQVVTLRFPLLCIVLHSFASLCIALS